MRTKLDVFALILLVIFGAGFLLAISWPLEARLFPFVMCSGGMVVALAQLILHSRKGKPVAPSAPNPNIAAMKRDLGAFGWVSAFFGAVMVFGFQWGLPLLIFLYRKFQGKAGLATAILSAIIGGVILYAISSLLHLPLYAGLIVERWF